MACWARWACSRWPARAAWGAFTAGALLLWSLPLVLVPALPVLAPVLVLLALVGVGNVLFDVTTVTLLQRAVPAHLLGRAFGALETVVVVGLGAGALAAPLLDGLVGAAGAAALLGAPLAVVAAVSLAPLRRLDASLEAPVRQVELLRALPPFALLPVPALERLALRLQRLEVAAGDVLVQQGEPGRTWYLVDDGELQVRVDGRDVAVLSAGEAFGEIALLRQGVRTATVAAATPAALWSLDGRRLPGRARRGRRARVGRRWTSRPARCCGGPRRPAPRPSRLRLRRGRGPRPARPLRAPGVVGLRRPASGGCGPAGRRPG